MSEELRGLFNRVYIYGGLFGLAPLIISQVIRLIMEIPVPLSGVLSTGQLCWAATSISIFCLAFVNLDGEKSAKPRASSAKAWFIAIIVSSALGIGIARWVEYSPERPENRRSLVDRMSKITFSDLSRIVEQGQQAGSNRATQVVSEEIGEKAVYRVLEESLESWRWVDRRYDLHIGVLSVILLAASVYSSYQYMKWSVTP